MYLPVESALMAWWLGTSKTDAGTAKIIEIEDPLTCYYWGK